MPEEHAQISSRQHPLVRRCRDLADRRSEGVILIDGVHLVRDALAASVPIEALLVDDERAETDGELADLVAQARDRRVNVIRAAPRVMEAASPVRSPSPAVAIGVQQWTPFATLAEAPRALLLFIVGVQDPGNVGAIVRAADALGASGVIVTRDSADPFGWKALRGAMGSAFRVPVAHVPAPAAAIASFRERGGRVIAADSQGETPLSDADLTGPLALLVGNEGQGLDGALIEAADLRVRIPMRAGVESLNVATASAILLYEVHRQRHGDHRPVR